MHRRRGVGEQWKKTNYGNNVLNQKIETMCVDIYR